LGRRHFVLARRIAAELREVPDQWEASILGLRHPKLDMMLWMLSPGEVDEIRTPSAHWRPNLFERRIISRAVRARTRRKLSSTVFGPPANEFGKIARVAPSGPG
jgi:hypothetical protein